MGSPWFRGVTDDPGFISLLMGATRAGEVEALVDIHMKVIVVPPSIEGVIYWDTYVSTKGAGVALANDEAIQIGIGIDPLQFVGLVFPGAGAPL
jgi:hypothetical protein